MTNTRIRIITGERGRSPSRIRTNPSGYLVLTEKGFEFVEKWFHTDGRVPPHLAKLYQLLLRMVSFRGIMSIRLTLKSGYHQRVISEAVSKKYAVLAKTQKNPPKEVQWHIKEMVGTPPKEIYI